ncbi:uncharacterized protein BROUX77_003437 [Berkeleyomyces rouxiae]|uniref:uncharacterized protein n=1 Tax=Berkeleyomyces rouxiae TaxID=2035830 RepID=UPI003B785285
MILGKPWMEKNDVVYSAKERMITFKDQGDRLIVREKGWREAHAGAPKASMVMAAVFAAEIRRGRKSKQNLQVFSASIQDINKALENRYTPASKMAKSTEKLTKTTLSNSSIDSKTSSSSASNKIDKKPTARDETRRTTRLGLSFAQMASQEPRSDDDELLRSPSQPAPVTSSMKVDAGVEDAPVVEIPSTPDSRDSDATTPTPNALDGNLFVFSQAQRDENDTNNTNNGTFRGSPTRAVEVEAGLPPPSIRFAKARMAYAARTLRLQRNHPVRVASQPDKDELAPDDSDLPLLGHNMSVKTRLGCIMRELKPLVAGMWRRERRRQEWDSPWQPPLTDRISIVVDPGPKEDAAVRHAQFLSRLPNDAVTVYTDGSKEGSRCSLAACVVDTKTGEIKTKVSHRLQDVEVADCESAAIVEALTLLAKTEKITKQARPCYVFVDSQAAIARLRKHGHFAWQARRVLGTFTSPVTVMWCPGHMGIAGNEIADAVARQALESDDERKFSSLGSVFARVRRFTMDKWETLWAFERDTAAGPSHGSHYLRTIGGDPVLRAKAPKVSGPRWLTSAYFQMKVGKGNLLPYLLLIKKTDSDRCRRCQEHESESVEHVLLHCAAFSAERQEMAMALSPQSLDLPTLFNTNNGTEVLLKFVRKTGFCTKAWVKGVGRRESSGGRRVEEVITDRAQGNH